MLYDKMENQIAVIFFLFKINHLLSNEFDQSLQEKKKIFHYTKGIYMYAVCRIFLCQFLQVIQRIKK
jgi:hypothetical protein